MNLINSPFHACSDPDIPAEPGLYCLKITDLNTLPDVFKKVLLERNHNIVYIGIALRSIKKRLEQELKAKGHGTFFRSVGAMLGFKPPRGSLNDNKNKRNYTFSKEDEESIINWIDANLTVNWVTQNDGLEELELGLIQKHLPLLNLKKNPKPLKTLKLLRRECQDIATSH